MVLAALCQDWHALRFASQRLREDWDVVLTALRLDAKALSLAPKLCNAAPSRFQPSFPSFTALSPGFHAVSAWPFSSFV